MDYTWDNRPNSPYYDENIQVINPMWQRIYGPKETIDPFEEDEPIEIKKTA